MARTPTTANRGLILWDRVKCTCTGDFANAISNLEWHNRSSLLPEVDWACSLFILLPCSEMRALEAPSKVAFVRFRDADSCNVALHLHETVMGDRQLRITKSDLGWLAHMEGGVHT